ncbi:retinol dehydrogenase 16-like [Ambystoma mexicanum]|uniref:retinol dehydrogenase 16-like n=1 Tax=Ambystoma mexicanum TaxID=8296 RepID=UPI0037E953EA
MAMWLLLVALLGLYFLLRWYRERETLPNLREKFVLITGCDTGFGNVLARQLDQRGMLVLAACLTPKGAQELKQATSQRLQTVILDVSDSKSVAAMAQWVKEQVGDRGLWGLVNNAGILIPVAPNEWLTKEDFLRVLNVNLVGLVDVTLSLLPLLRKTQGRIVNVSSIAGRLGLCGGGYSISKYGVEAFSDSLRRDLATFGVKVSIIEPDFFKTQILNEETLTKSLRQVWASVPAEVQQSYGHSYFEDYCKYILHMIQLTTPKLYLVTDSMEHALTAVHPRTRYSAGMYAKFFYVPLSYMPTALADRLLTFSP